MLLRQEMQSLLRGCSRSHARAGGGERRYQHVTRVLVVVDDEDPDAVQGNAARGRSGRWLGERLRSRGNRKSDRKRCAVIGSVALRLDVTAVQLDEVAHDRQAEAHAAVRARRGRVRLAEAFEHVREELGRDADARVAHL